MKMPHEIILTPEQESQINTIWRQRGAGVAMIAQPLTLLSEGGKIEKPVLRVGILTLQQYAQIESILRDGMDK